MNFVFHALFLGFAVFSGHTFNAEAVGAELTLMQYICFWALFGFAVLYGATTARAGVLSRSLGAFAVVVMSMLGFAFGAASYSVGVDAFIGTTPLFFSVVMLATAFAAAWASCPQPAYVLKGIFMR